MLEMYHDIKKKVDGWIIFRPKHYEKGIPEISFNVRITVFQFIKDGIKYTPIFTSKNRLISFCQELNRGGIDMSMYKVGRVYGLSNDDDVFVSDIKADSILNHTTGDLRGLNN